jgi:hypothetical protein
VQKSTKAGSDFVHGIALGDLHCGSLLGLTHPEYQIGMVSSGNRQRKKYARVQRELWNFYSKTLEDIGMVDFAIVNGDLIDGDGSRLNGIEQITTDRLVQADMAVAALSIIKTPLFALTRGTPYHVGYDEEFEDPVKEKLVNLGYNATIGNHEWLNIGGAIFDVKHFVHSSTSPLGRNAAVERDALWNILWYVAEEQPKADVVLRSHAHYFKYSGGGDGPLMMVLPSLQAMGTRFGSKICSGRVHIGLVEFWVNRETSEVTFKPHIAKLTSHKASAAILCA